MTFHWLTGPMGSIVGHEDVMAFLAQTAQRDRPAHAYLFTGREGIGKKAIALIFASLLNCPDTEADKDRTCPTCDRIGREVHPDVLVERPERGIIRIDRIRAITDFFRYAPVEGRHRIVIVDDAHLMNLQAQNALLKTLEEPPPGNILILISSKPASLLPTVRSRCRRIRFKPIDTETLAQWLAHEKGMDPATARTPAALACGSPGRAEKIHRSKALATRDRFIQMLIEPAARGIQSMLDLSQEISASRDGALDAIEMASTWIRDVLLAKLAAEGPRPIHSDLLDMTASTAQHHSTAALLSVHGELRKAAQLIEAEINVNTRLVIDVMFLRTARILHGPSMGLDTTRSARD